MATLIGCPETNYYANRHGFFPQAIVIHSFVDELAGGEAVILDPKSRLSVHYTVSLAGNVFQYVHETDTAFHAGIAVNPTCKLLDGVNPNFYTIGVALESRPGTPPPAAQLSTAASLVLEIAARWGINVDSEHILEHSRIRASRNCPGDGLVSKLLDAIPASNPPLPKAITTLRVVRNVNVRRGRPNTLAPVVRVLSAGSDMSVVGFSLGQRVEGNAYWYADPEGNYVWAGATSVPLPNPAG